MSKIIAIDFFCGAGGVTKGLSESGIEVLKGIDIDSTAKETYEKNNPGSKFVHADITKISPLEVVEGINRKGKKLVFVGCAPCQPYSQINPNKNSRDKKIAKRKSLIGAFAQIVSQVLPEFIFIENVPKFADGKNKYFGDLIKTLKHSHYYYDYKYVNAKDYGVPQNRRRFVLLASLEKPVSIPESDFGKNDHIYVTVRDALKKYPKIRAGQAHPDIPNHIARKISEKNIERLKYTSRDGGKRENWPKNLVLECHKGISGYSDTYGRMKWDEPAPTLTCKCTSLSNGRFGHPDQNRAISVREAASLQTFPDNYIFYGNLSDTTRHVGNAVPVLLARKIGELIIRMN